jgi:hypothetical protein
VIFQVAVLRVVTPCSVVVGYQRFGGPYCLYLQGEVADVGEIGIDIGPDLRREATAVSSSKNGVSPLFECCHSSVKT